MNYNSLIDILKSRPIAVELMEGCNDFESYPERGLRANLTSVDLDPHDLTVKLTFNFSEFDEYNQVRESKNYYDSNMVSCLSAREKGVYKLVDFYYASSDNPPDYYFKPIPQSSLALMEEYCMYRDSDNTSSGALTYTSWLESRLALFI